MTRRLIEGAGFNAIAVEADWPAAYRLDCFVRGAGKDRTAADALGDFLRFPRWMWRNQVVEAFAVWLRAYNKRAHEGTVTAASDWGTPGVVKRVEPRRGDAYEGELHDAGLRRDLVLFESGLEVDPRRLERAIGVIYRPETERQSHYFEAEMARQFDAVAHLDRTQALWPLDRDPAGSRRERRPRPTRSASRGAERGRITRACAGYRSAPRSALDPPDRAARSSACNRPTDARSYAHGRRGDLPGPP